MDLCLGSELALALPRRASNGKPHLEPLPSHHGTNHLYVAHYPNGCISVIKVYAQTRAGLLEQAALEALGESCTAGEVPALYGSFQWGTPAVLVLEMEWLAGTEFCLSHDRAGHALVGKLGELLANVHAAITSVRRRGAAGWGSLIVPAARPGSWGELLGERLHRRAEALGRRGVALDPSTLGALERRIHAARDLLAHAAPALLHNDLHSSNFVVGGRAPIALIDFERSSIGHWLYDVVKLSWCVFGDCPVCLRCFFDGYGASFDGDTEALLQLYRLLYDVEMIAYLIDHTSTDQNRALLESQSRHLRENA